MGSNVTFPMFTLILLLLVASNVFWAYIYYMDEYRDVGCLRDGATALAIMLGHTGYLLQELGENRSSDSLGLAYLNVDHAVLVAQALYRLTGTDEWKSLYSAVGSLHGFIADMYQGTRVSEEKLIRVGEVLKELSKSLKELNTRNIKKYSEELVNLLHT